MEIYHIEEGLGRGHPKPLLLMTDLANLLSEIDPRVQAHWDGNRDREHVLTRVPREYRNWALFFCIPCPGISTQGRTTESGCSQSQQGRSEQEPRSSICACSLPPQGLSDKAFLPSAGHFLGKPGMEAIKQYRDTVFAISPGILEIMINVICSIHLLKIQSFLLDQKTPVFCCPLCA